MAKTAKSAWGIDIGNSTFKALKLGIDPDGVEVQDFLLLEHEQIISQGQLEPQRRAEIINKALNQFLEARDVRDSAIVVSIPGQSSFARFIKLPPVEPKRIPELVRFEAIQQIPFEINDVEWDWQLFDIPDSPDVEVGIFAIKRDLVKAALEPFARVDCNVDVVQMAPMALYNFLRYDHKRLQDPSSNKAIIALDIGADNTDLVIANGQRVWQRAIPIGGNQFTTAIQKAFKLSFAKAESIKRTASTSKYTRQLFQAMRPVFADLAAEIQRSIGFYRNTNSQVQFREVIALGSTVRLPGLMKFLQQSLSLPVKRLASYDSLRLASDVSMAQFSGNLSNLTGVYGLALQGLGLATINSNILPREIARASLWKKKHPWFIAASAVFAATSLLCLLQAQAQKIDIESDQTKQALNEIKHVKSYIENRKSAKTKALSDIEAAQAQITEYAAPYQDRTIIPQILRAIRQCTPNEGNLSDPAQKAMHQAYRNADRAGVMAVPRSQRQQIILSNIRIVYAEDLSQSFSALGFGRNRTSSRLRSRSRSSGSRGGRGLTAAAKTPGFVVLLEGSTPHEDDLVFLEPPDVGLDREKWGFFHRLQYLGKTNRQILAEQAKRRTVLSANANPSSPKTVAAPGTPAPPEAEMTVAEQAAAALPFETFIDPTAGKITDYFDTSQTNWVGIGGDVQPAGLGITKETKVENTSGTDLLSERRRSSPGKRRAARSPAENKNAPSGPILIDPLTLETVSCTYARDAAGEIRLNARGEPILERHDYWFKVLLKIKLKDNKPAPLTARN